MIRLKHLMTLFLLSLLMIMTSCVYVPECEEEEHPHTGNFIFQYNWQNLTQNGKEPDSLVIISHRVIMKRVTAMVYDNNTSSGCYLDNLPLTLPQSENHDITSFKMPVGHYKFLTTNYNSTTWDLQELYDYIAEKRTSHLTSVHATYITHPEPSKVLQWQGDEWTDYNQYSHTDGEFVSYIEPSEDPLVIDTTGLYELGHKAEVVVQFVPNQLTHNIDMIFDLKKDPSVIPFTVDSAYCIISGVPHTINIGNGSLDIENTDKFVCQAMPVAYNETSLPDKSAPIIEDTRTSTNVRLYHNVNLFGIVENKVPKDGDFTGPGIVQMLIFTTIYEKDDEGNETTRVKKIHGIVNMHHALKKAQLQITDPLHGITTKSREHSDLHVKINMTIGKYLLETPDDGGIDKWVEHEEGSQGGIDDSDFDIY